MAEELKDQRISIMLTASELKELDDWSFAKRIRSRGEAVRQLIHSGLAARPILLDVQKMLISLRPVGGDSDLDAHIEAIHAALNSKSR